MMRGYSLKIAGFVFCAALIVGLFVVTSDLSAQDNAIRSSSGGIIDLSGSGLNPVPDSAQRFDFEVVDTGALELARKVYAGYVKSIGMQPSFEDPDFARYVPLMPGHNRRFLAYYRWDRIRNGCPPLGCLTHVFENFNGNKWRLVMDVFAHDFWIDPRSGNSKTPRDIYLFSSYGSASAPNYASDTNVQQVGSFETLGRWSWDEQTNKYISNGAFYMTDYPYKEE
jgi:hypothetical protein